MRQSNFELLRIAAMFFIVLYHLLLTSASLYGYDERGLQTLWIPLHIAVPVFVLISGYFRIRPSVKGMVRLILPVAVYYIPIEMAYNMLNSGG